MKKPKPNLSRRPLKTLPEPPEPTAAQLAIGAPEVETARTGGPNIVLSLARMPPSLRRS